MLDPPCSMSLTVEFLSRMRMLAWVSEYPVLLEGEVGSSKAAEGVVAFVPLTRCFCC